MNPGFHSVRAGGAGLLAGLGTWLVFLGAASSGGQHCSGTVYYTDGSNGSGTVYYTDGSMSTFQLPLASYRGPPGPGDDPVAVVPYMNGGPAGQPGYVCYAGVPISPAKTVQAVTLPKHDSGPPGGMHIFAVGIGPLQVPE